jgi:hypothetical protein
MPIKRSWRSIKKRRKPRDTKVCLEKTGDMLKGYSRRAALRKEEYDK